jgi:hypothetical protein
MALAVCDDKHAVSFCSIGLKGVISILACILASTNLCCHRV